MKTLFFIPALISFVLISCKSNLKKSKTERAQDSIVVYLKANLNDPGSYQLIKFDSLRNDSSSVLDDKDYNRVYMNMDNDSINIIEKNFKPHFVGYKMGIAYRAKNGFGALMPYFFIYYFDKNLKITSNTDVSKYATQ